MARQPNDNAFEPGSITAEASDGANWIRVGPRRFLPEAFIIRAEIRQLNGIATLQCAVAGTGDLHVTSVSIAPDGTRMSVTTTMVRAVLVDYLARTGATLLARTVGESDGPAAHAIRNFRPTKEDKIRRAAEVYLESISLGSSSPLKNVADQLGYSWASANRFVKEARAQGLLRRVEPNS